MVSHPRSNDRIVSVNSKVNVSILRIAITTTFLGGPLFSFLATRASMIALSLYHNGACIRVCGFTTEIRPMPTHGLAYYVIGQFVCHGVMTHELLATRLTATRQATRRTCQRIHSS